MECAAARFLNSAGSHLVGHLFLDRIGRLQQALRRLGQIIAEALLLLPLLALISRLERLNSLLETLSGVSRSLLLFVLCQICRPVEQLLRLNGQIDDVDLLASRFVFRRGFLLDLGLRLGPLTLLEDEWDLRFFRLLLLCCYVFHHFQECRVLHRVNLNSKTLCRVVIILLLNLL